MRKIFHAIGHQDLASSPRTCLVCHRTLGPLKRFSRHSGQERSLLASIPNIVQLCSICRTSRAKWQPCGGACSWSGTRTGNCPRRECGVVLVGNSVDGEISKTCTVKWHRSSAGLNCRSSSSDLLCSYQQQREIANEGIEEECKHFILPSRPLYLATVECRDKNCNIIVLPKINNKYWLF